MIKKIKNFINDVKVEGISKITIDEQINIEAAFKKQGKVTFYVNPESFRCGEYCPGI